MPANTFGEIFRLTTFGESHGTAIGGIIEVVPLFTIETTVEHVKGIRPYTPLEQRGRDIYVRGLLRLPQPASPRPARRGGALRAFLAGGGEYVRPSVPVGFQAHWP